MDLTKLFPVPSRHLAFRDCAIPDLCSETLLIVYHVIFENARDVASRKLFENVSNTQSVYFFGSTVRVVIVHFC